MKKLITITTIFILMLTTQYLSAQDWHIAGNSGTDASLNFIGTSDNVALKLRTNNKVRLTISSSGKVGIGTTNPQEKFHVDGTGILARFGTGTTSTTTNYCFIDNTLGTYIEQRGNTTTVGSDFLVLQSSKSGNKVDYSQFYIDPDDGFLFNTLGNGNGNVGIGAFSPGYKFYVRNAAPYNAPVAYIENTVASNASNGLFIKGGSNGSYGSLFISFIRPDGLNIGSVEQGSANSIVYLTLSDKRLKNIIGTSQKGLADLMKIKIYDYTFKSDPAQQVLTGFMAQELYDIFPQSVSKPRDNNEPAEKNPWMVDYGSVTPLIIKSVQEQQQMIDELTKQNADLKKEVEELKSSIVNRESSMNDGFAKLETQNTKSETLLGQNIPNPFDNSTLIPFRIPKDCHYASIMITNTSTKEVISVIPISCDEDHVGIDGGKLSIGTYSYSLIVNGIIVDSKQIELVKE